SSRASRRAQDDMAEPGMTVSATATAPAVLAGREGARWFSANPDKAWAEKFFLAYTPIWMAAFGFYQRSRIGDRFGDVGNLLAVPLAVAAAAWFWAWAEIRLTTDPSIADQFRYEDMAWALRWGAVFYATSS